TPNTWKEVIAILDLQAPGVCSGRRVAVQEYGASNPELVEALQQRGASVLTVPLYRWELPDDVGPLRSAVRRIIDGSIDVMLLTASVQLQHLLTMAGEMQLELELRAALDRLVIASVGPMTTDEIRRQGLRVSFEASHPKMGFLVKEAAEHCRAAQGS